MARPERFELPTTWFVARYSIQLSYGRVERRDYSPNISPIGDARAQPPRLRSNGRAKQPWGKRVQFHPEKRDGEAARSRPD